MHIAHAFAVAPDHARYVDLSGSEVRGIGTEEDITRIGQFHNRVYLWLGLYLRSKMRMHAGQDAEIITGASSLIDRLCGLTRFLWCAAAGGARAARAKDEPVHADNGEETGEAFIALNHRFSLCRVAKAAATIEGGEAQVM